MNSQWSIIVITVHFILRWLPKLQIPLFLFPLSFDDPISPLETWPWTCRTSFWPLSECYLWNGKFSVPLKFRPLTIIHGQVWVVRIYPWGCRDELGEGSRPYTVILPSSWTASSWWETQALLNSGVDINVQTINHGAYMCSHQILLSWSSAC